MRWRKPYLLVGEENGMVVIWQFSATSSVLLGEWDSKVGRVKRVDFDTDLVVVLGFGYTSSAEKKPKIARLAGQPPQVCYFGADCNVFTFTGHHIRRIGQSEKTWDMGLHNGHLITADVDHVVRI